MAKKLGIRILFVLAICGTISSITLLFFSLSILSHNKKIQAKLAVFEAREIRLSNMENALQTLYHLSKYETHYYAIIFDDFATQYQIPWETFPALMKQESGFNPTLTSPKGAKGFTQMLDGTAKIVAGKLGIRFNTVTPWNDILNMVMGFTYFVEGFSEKKDSASAEISLKHAMQRYVGGPAYSKVNPSAKEYVGEYKNTLWQEYVKLSYIYKGLLFEQSTQSEIRKSTVGTCTIDLVGALVNCLLPTAALAETSR